MTAARRISKELARTDTSMEEKSSSLLSETWWSKRVKHPPPTVATLSTHGTMIWSTTG